MLTERERQVLDFIQTFRTQNGYSPSYREIGRGIDTNSRYGVGLWINNLVDKGYIKVTYNINRSIVVLKEVDE
jgi:repressor LexA